MNLKDYIADIIEDMGITQAEFATRMGTTAKTLSYLLNVSIKQVSYLDIMDFSLSTVVLNSPGLS